MNNILFVREGCRPCMYVETQLKKCEGWEEVVTISQAEVDGVWTEEATMYGVDSTPTLVGTDEDGVLLGKISGADNMNRDFWKQVILRHKQS
jgi:thioredoxin-related protein